MKTADELVAEGVPLLEAARNEGGPGEAYDTLDRFFADNADDIFDALRERNTNPAVAILGQMNIINRQRALIDRLADERASWKRFAGECQSELNGAKGDTMRAIEERDRALGEASALQSALQSAREDSELLEWLSSHPLKGDVIVRGVVVKEKTAWGISAAPGFSLRDAIRIVMGWPKGGRQ